jgi:hypothetical protein
MEVLRVLVKIALYLGLATYLSLIVFRGLTTGKIAYSSSNTYCQKSKNPIGFRFLVILFSVVIILCGFAVWHIAIRF